MSPSFCISSALCWAWIELQGSGSQFWDLPVPGSPLTYTAPPCWLEICRFNILSNSRVCLVLHRGRSSVGALDTCNAASTACTCRYKKSTRTQNWVPFKYAWISIFPLKTSVDINYSRTIQPWLLADQAVPPRCPALRCADLACGPSAILQSL